MSDTRQALEEAFRTVFPPPPNAHLGIDVPALEAHTQIVRRFRRFLDAEAWTDAAMMLVPEGWDYALYSRGEAAVHRSRSGRRTFLEGTADHPALALAQACLKARENGDGAN